MLRSNPLGDATGMGKAQQVDFGEAERVYKGNRGAAARGTLRQQRWYGMRGIINGCSDYCSALASSSQEVTPTVR